MTGIPLSQNKKKIILNSDGDLEIPKMFPIIICIIINLFRKFHESLLQTNQ